MPASNYIPVTWFWLALLSAGSISVVSIIDKIVVERLLRDRWSFPFFIAFFLGLYVTVTVGDQDYWNTSGLSRAALLPIAALRLVHGDHRRLIGRVLRTRGGIVLPGMAALELLAIVPLVLSTIAYALGPLALVSAVRYTTPLFVLVLTVALNRLWAGVVPEPSGRGSVLRRAALTIGIRARVLMAT